MVLRVSESLKCYMLLHGISALLYWLIQVIDA